MKNLTNLLFCTILIATGGQVFAELGGDRGNGGLGYVCKNGKAYFADVIELEQRGWKLDMGGPDLSPWQKAELVFTRLARLHPQLSQTFLERLKQFKSDAIFADNYQIGKLSETTYLGSLRDCKEIHIAIRQLPPLVYGDKSFVIDNDTVKKFASADHFAAMITHEIVYEYLSQLSPTDKYNLPTHLVGTSVGIGDTESRAASYYEDGDIVFDAKKYRDLVGRTARNFNGVLISDEFSRLDTQQYITLLNKQTLIMFAPVAGLLLKVNTYSELSDCKNYNCHPAPTFHSNGTLEGGIIAQDSDFQAHTDNGLVDITCKAESYVLWDKQGQIIYCGRATPKTGPIVVGGLKSGTTIQELHLYEKSRSVLMLTNFDQMKKGVARLTNPDIAKINHKLMDEMHSSRLSFYADGKILGMLGSVKISASPLYNILTDAEIVHPVTWMDSKSLFVQICHMIQTVNADLCRGRRRYSSTSGLFIIVDRNGNPIPKYILSQFDKYGRKDIRSPEYSDWHSVWREAEPTEFSKE